jgi:hypothetical protein
MTRLSFKLRDYERICDETYQVVGVLASEANRFMDDEVTKVLDNLSLQEIVHEDIIPFSNKKTMPSDKEIKEAKESLESIKESCEVEYYEKLKTLLDYF